eukprot:2995644-Amphidinium_carterae.1
MDKLAPAAADGSVQKRRLAADVERRPSKKVLLVCLVALRVMRWCHVLPVKTSRGGTPGYAPTCMALASWRTTAP